MIFPILLPHLDLECLLHFLNTFCHRYPARASLGAFGYSFILIYADNLSFRIPFTLFEIPDITVYNLIFTVVASLMSLPFGRLADIMGRKKVLLRPYDFWRALCLGLIYASSLAGIVSLFFLYGLQKATAEPVQRALVSVRALLARM